MNVLQLFLLVFTLTILTGGAAYCVWSLASGFWRWRHDHNCAKEPLVAALINPALVSAVLVTRGDADLSQIVESLQDAGIEDVVIWDNAQRGHDLACYGRYAAIAEARHDWIWHQDDDLVVPVAQVLERYDPVRDRYTIVANNRPDEDWPLTAMGVVFHRDLAECFEPYLAAHGFDDDFCRVCDVVFAYMNAYRQVWVGYEDLPNASAPNSMYLQEGHMHVRIRARLRTLELPVAVTA